NESGINVSVLKAKASSLLHEIDITKILSMVQNIDTFIAPFMQARQSQTYFDSTLSSCIKP
ncbi:MAG: hypothetical protein P4L31_00300, partial [Candidatus Babeliales bacterium]|nr:hypothetical protein [Candidatus Babeliales bacterium]